MDWFVNWTAWDHHQKRGEPLHYAPLAQSSGIERHRKEFFSPTSYQCKNNKGLIDPPNGEILVVTKNEPSLGLVRVHF